LTALFDFEIPLTISVVAKPKSYDDDGAHAFSFVCSARRDPRRSFHLLSDKVTHSTFRPVSSFHKKNAQNGRVLQKDEEK
jgi:hypothetical protein